MVISRRPISRFRMVIPKRQILGEDDDLEETNPTCPVTVSGHSRYVRAVSWSPDGTMLASGSDDKTIKLWDVQSGKVNSTLTVDSGVYNVVFSADGSKIAAAYSNKVQLFDAKTQAKLGSPLRGHSAW